MGSDGEIGSHATGISTDTVTTTGQKLIEVATHLLDSGGDEAVTLRAVGQAAGLSHNAPYKHFANRAALLSSVAAASFAELANAAKKVRMSDQSPIEKLRTAIGLLIAFSRQRPARYQLLFNNADTAAAGGEVKFNAMATFEEFRSIVEECQDAGSLPRTPSHTLASLTFACVQGLLAIEGNGALHPEKGLSSVEASVALFLGLLSPQGAADAALDHPTTLPQNSP